MHLPRKTIHATLVDFTIPLQPAGTNSRDKSHIYVEKDTDYYAVTLTIRRSLMDCRIALVTATV